jgi:hypothetical protein
MFGYFQKRMFKKLSQKCLVPYSIAGGNRIICFLPAKCHLDVARWEFEINDTERKCVQEEAKLNEIKKRKFTDYDNVNQVIVDEFKVVNDNLNNLKCKLLTQRSLFKGRLEQIVGFRFYDVSSFFNHYKHKIDSYENTVTVEIDDYMSY